MSDKEYITKRKIIDEIEGYKEYLFKAMCALYEGEKQYVTKSLITVYNDIKHLQNRIKLSVEIDDGKFWEEKEKDE